MKTFNSLRDEIYNIDLQKGVYDKKISDNEYCLIFCNELINAYEEYKKFNDFRIYYEYNPIKKIDCVEKQKIYSCEECNIKECFAQKPCGVPSSLAGLILKLLSYCGKFNIDVDFNLQYVYNLKFETLFPVNFVNFVDVLYCFTKYVYDNMEKYSELGNYQVNVIIRGLQYWFEINKIDLFNLIRRKVNFESIEKGGVIYAR